MADTQTSTSWLCWNGKSGNHFVDIPLKPPLKLRWKKKLKLPTIAIAHADRVVVRCDGSIEALNLQTGECVWRVQEYGKKSYEFVLPAGDAEAVYFHARTEFRAVRWDNGETIWSHKRKRLTIIDPDDPIVAGPYLLLRKDVLDKRTGTTIRNDPKGHNDGFAVGNRFVRYRFDPHRLECLDISSGKLLWCDEYAKQPIIAVNDPGPGHHISYSLEAAWEGYTLARGGPYDNSWWYLQDMASGRILSQTPSHLLPEPWNISEDWDLGATDGRELYLFWARDERGASPGRGSGTDYFSRPQAFALPDFKYLWEGELLFHQDSHVGSPYQGLLTRDYFYYVWRNARDKNPKTYLTALNRTDGTVAFQCTVGPWAESILAVDDALIIIGRGGTVFCYGEK